MTVVSRLLALAVAVGLIVGALAVRGGRDVAPVGDGGVPTSDEALAVLCPSEFAALCSEATEADVTVSALDAASIAERLDEDVSTVAVLPAAWVDVVDDVRDRRGAAALSRSAPIVSTPLLLVAFEDRLAVLAAACRVAPEAVGWACVGDNVGQRWEDLGGDERWGDVRVGHLPPDTATGLQATASVVAARTGLPFSLADLRDVGVASWFRQVERAVTSFRPPGGSHLTGMVTRGPSSANIAVVTEAELAGRDLGTTFGPLAVTVPSPLFAVELVLAGTDDDAVRAAAAAIDPAAFAAAGWRTDAGTPPAGAPVDALPPVDPTPSGGVLTAVRSAWADAVG